MDTPTSPPSQYPSSQNHDKIIHLAFEVGAVLKGLNGLLEVLGGVLMYITSPRQITHFVRLLTQEELSEDPRDFVATHLLHTARHLSQGEMNFAGVYLLSHGILKVLLVWALLRRRLWAYPVAIVVFGAFAVYQIYRYSLTHALSMIALTMLDLFVITLTWIEYRRLKRAAEFIST